MRLIDADKLIEEIKYNSQKYCDCKGCDGKGNIIRVSEVEEIITEQPTSDDIDKVAEELKKLKQYTLSIGDMVCDIHENGTGRHFVCLEEVIEIVKAGAVKC